MPSDPVLTGDELGELLNKQRVNAEVEVKRLHCGTLLGVARKLLFEVEEISDISTMRARRELRVLEMRLLDIK